LWGEPQGNGLGVHFIGSVGAVYAWPGIYRTLYGANISFSGEAIFSRYTTFDSDCIYLAPVEANACNQLVRQIRANRNDVWATRDFGWWTSMNGVHVPDPEGYPVGLRLPPIPLPATGLGLPGALIALAVLVVERRRQGWLRGG
jgi:hypothetical protein